MAGEPKIDLGWLDQCRAWCRQVKYLNDPLAWEKKPSRSDFLIATSALLDVNKVVIPHLTFKGEYYAGRHGEQVSYGLMYRHGRELHRVFMLDIYPSHVRSHREPDGTNMFGPHIHLGDERLMQLTREVITQIGAATAQKWVERFRRHARIQNHKRAALLAPFGDHDIFG